MKPFLLKHDELNYGLVSYQLIGALEYLGGALILHVRSLANGDTDPGDCHREDQIQITTEILPKS